MTKLRSSSADSKLRKRLPLGIRSASREREKNEYAEELPEDNSSISEELEKLLAENDPKKIDKLIEEYLNLSPSKRGGKRRKNKTKKRLQKNIRKSFCRR
jgi:hypothetical protein